MKLQKKRSAKLVILFSFILILGCGQLRLVDFEKTFKKIEITNLDDSSTLIMYIELSNKNSFDIALDSISYNLFIDGRLCGTGVFKEHINLEAHKNKRISLPLWISYLGLDKVSKSVLQNKLTTPQYKLTGELLIEYDEEQISQKFVITNK